MEEEMKELNTKLELSIKEAERSIKAENMKEIASFEKKEIALEGDMKLLKNRKEDLEIELEKKQKAMHILSAQVTSLET
jgi:hypothetical protein